MAGTRTTPPPMPRRPTSTPTPSPRRRIVNIMVTGRFRAHRLDDADQALLSCSLRRPAATSLEQAATIENARLFLFARNLLYLLVFSHVGPVPCWRLCGSPQRGIPENVNPLIPAKPGSDKKEECDRTHATRTETRVFQRFSAQGGNHWLRLRRLAAGAALRRSGTQSHGI